MTFESTVNLAVTFLCSFYLLLPALTALVCRVDGEVALPVGGAALPLPPQGRPPTLLCLAAQGERVFAFPLRRFSALLRPSPTIWDFLLPCRGKTPPISPPNVGLGSSPPPYHQPLSCFSLFYFISFYFIYYYFFFIVCVPPLMPLPPPGLPLPSPCPSFIL